MIMGRGEEEREGVGEGRERDQKLQPLQTASFRH